MNHYIVTRTSRDGTVRHESGTWNKAADAMRDFIVRMEPSLAEADDALIRKHWASMRRNHGVEVAKNP